MAKLNVTVDNGIDDVKLESIDKLKSKKEKQKVEEKTSKKKKSENKKVKTKKENYLKEVSNEMKLVSWPSKKSVVKYSFATILMIVFLSVFFIGLTVLFDLLYRLAQGWIG